MMNKVNIEVVTLLEYIGLWAIIDRNCNQFLVGLSCGTMHVCTFATQRLLDNRTWIIVYKWQDIGCAGILLIVTGKIMI